MKLPASMPRLQKARARISISVVHLIIVRGHDEIDCTCVADALIARYTQILISIVLIITWWWVRQK